VPFDFVLLVLFVFAVFVAHFLGISFNLFVLFFLI